jgi:ParB/RepB/Spo0J family partition protein
MVVRKNEDGYELIAGERRWTAIGMLIRDKRVLPEALWDTLVRNDVDDPKQTAAMIVENLHRAGLTPVEELSGIVRLQSEYSWTAKEIALATGIPESTVKARLKWTKLPDHVINAIGSSISVGDANKLAGFNAEAVAKLTAKNKVPAAYDISEHERTAEKERTLNRIRKLLESKGHHVVNRVEWEILINPNVGSHDARLQPARDALVAMRELVEANEGWEIQADWVSVDKEALDEYLVDVAPGAIFRLDATYSTQLYHHYAGAPAEDDDPEEELSDFDRAYQDARAEYDKAKEQWNGQRLDAVNEFLNGKPADVMMWVLGKALARENYLVEKDDTDLRKLIGLDATNPTLSIYALKSTANMARVIAGAGFLQRYNDPPNCPPRPEMAVIDEDAYDEDGTFIPEDQRVPAEEDQDEVVGLEGDAAYEHVEDIDDDGEVDDDTSEYDPAADVDQAIEAAVN